MDDDTMKLALTLALTLAATLALGGCGETTELKFPREHRASYTCSIDQWEMVKKRINHSKSSRKQSQTPVCSLTSPN